MTLINFKIELDRRLVVFSVQVGTGCDEYQFSETMQAEIESRLVADRYATDY